MVAQELAARSGAGLAGVAKALRLHNLVLTLVLVGGIWLMAAPEDFMPRHQEIIGVAVMGLALAGFVFWNAGDLGFHEVVELHRVALGSFILITGFSLGLAFLWEKQDLRGVGVMGIIVLLTSILGANLLSERRGLSSEEVRTAITLSCFTMFYAFVAFAADEPLHPDSVLAATFAHFWQILIAVVAFYFGGMTIEHLGRHLDRGR